MEGYLKTEIPGEESVERFYLLDGMARDAIIFRAPIFDLQRGPPFKCLKALMPAGQNPASKPPLKNPILYSSLVLLAVFLYVIWIFFARWQENRQIQRQATEEKSQKQLEADRKTVEEMGGKELAIQSFYASAGIVHKGESLQLCYGVANAKTVKLEPQDNPVWPSYNRCVDVWPQKDTTYTLTIQDAAGNTRSQTLDIKVK